MLPGRSRVRRMSLDLLEDLDCGTEVPYIDPTLEEIQSVVERVRLLEFADKVHRRLSYNAGIEIYVGAFAKCHWNPTAHEIRGIKGDTSQLLLRTVTVISRIGSGSDEKALIS